MIVVGAYCKEELQCTSETSSMEQCALVVRAL
jgi:hypothetical protein